jgi:beta-glucosidase
MQPKVALLPRTFKCVDSVMKLMTLEENWTIESVQWFWEITGPTPKEGQAAKKYDDLKGLVGSMLNVKA